MNSKNTEVQSVIREALLADEARFSERDLESALGLSLAKAWARFSQGIRTDLARAELENDKVLQAKLMKDYLDVQRRMKELKFLCP